MKLNIKESIQNYRRVIAACKKPEYEELITTIRICAIGITLIGFIGFILYLLALLLSF
ncbi:MAG: protein translocase SEC61 complex subunit gamma [Candidatus Aenigmatarchaeota archaeon]